MQKLLKVKIRKKKVEKKRKSHFINTRENVNKQEKFNYKISVMYMLLER